MLHIIIVNFQGLNFRGSHIIRENKIYVPRKFVRVRYKVGSHLQIVLLYYEKYSHGGHLCRLKIKLGQVLYPEGTPEVTRIGED